MAHEIAWMKPGRVLYVCCQDHQRVDTIRACLDEMADELDKTKHPVAVLIDWQEVTDYEPKALLSQRGHRAYSHPMAARNVLVGMGGGAQFENQIMTSTTRGEDHNRYFDTLGEALDYLKYMLLDDPMMEI